MQSFRAVARVDALQLDLEQSVLRTLRDDEHEVHQTH